MIKLEGGQLWVSRTGTYERHKVSESYDAFDRQLLAFITAIETDTTPPVTPEYVRKLSSLLRKPPRELVRVLCASEKSAQTGREVLI